MARRADHTREELAKLIVDTATAMIVELGVEKLSARALSKQIAMRLERFIITLMIWMQ